MVLALWPFLGLGTLVVEAVETVEELTEILGEGDLLLLCGGL